MCGKKLLVGVLNRIDQLADRDYGFCPPRAVPYQNVIPLEEIIAETFGVGVASKKVVAMYEKIIANVGNGLKPFPTKGLWGEFAILLEMPEEQLASLATPSIAQSVMRVRQGHVHVEGGYDGAFGKIHIYSEEERNHFLHKPIQTALF